VTRFERQYRKVARRLSRIELTAHRQQADRTTDAYDLLYERDADRRFLDFYGIDGLHLAFEAYGIYDSLERRGYTSPSIHVHVQDDRHVLHIDATHPTLTSPARIVEIALRLDRLRASPAPELPPLGAYYDVLTVDWLQLCDPTRSFTRDRPRLPGQEYPGLGIGERVLEMLYRVASRLDLAAVCTVGEYFHNAWLYAREMPFFDPRYTGQLEALGDRLLRAEALSLAEASWAIDKECVFLDRSPFRWKGELQVRAREPALRAYLTSPAWRRLADQSSAATDVQLDRQRWADARRRLSLDPCDSTP
jgi:hypothetical protein